MEISSSFAILSDDDTNVHVVDGFNAKDEIQRMHVSVSVDELFEISELLKMPKNMPQEWESRKVGIEALNKQLKAWEEEKRAELNEMNWDEIWSFDGTFEQVRSNDINRLTSLSSIIKALLGYRTSIKVYFFLSSYAYKKKRKL
ncbi:hypothetical protein RFI_35796, partial [Reticulomyxa filosa]